MREIDKQKQEREAYLYHNTELLLKKYRDVVWSVELSALQTQMNFEAETDCAMESFLEMSYEAGFDFGGTQIQGQIRTMARNKKMLQIIDASVNLLRKKQNDGEEYYWILYFTYLSEKSCKNLDDIVRHVSEKTDFMSWKTYYKKRKKAIQFLSTILWGFTSKECLPIIEEFVE